MANRFLNDINAPGEIDLTGLSGQTINPLTNGSDIDGSSLITPMPTTADSPAPGTIVQVPSAVDPAALVTGVPEAPVPQNPGLDANGQPIMVTETSSDKTTGSTDSKSTTSQEQSQASREALADYTKGTDEEKAAYQDLIKAGEEQNRVDAEIATEKADAITHVETARIQAIQEETAEIQNDINTTKQMAVELANLKPETFWGSKSASDKIASALSIGLGSFAQATLGSGQNVGQVLLERQMGEFDRNQRQKFEAKVKQIEQMNTGITQKQALFKQTEKLYDANKLAALSKVEADYAKAASLAKTATVKAQIGQRMAGISQQKAKVEMEFAAKYEQRVTANHSENVINKLSTQNKALGLQQGIEQAKGLDKPLTDLSAVRSELSAGLKQLNNPNLSKEQKLQVAAGLMKAVNKSKESIGAEEAERLGAELRSSVSSLGKAISGGAVAGAGAGALAAGIPSLGIGAPVGGLIGGALGAAGGGAISAFDELGKPGGIRLSPDVDAFTQRLQGTLDNIDGTIARQSRLQQLVRKGLTIPQANALIDSEMK